MSGWLAGGRSTKATSHRCSNLILSQAILYQLDSEKLVLQEDASSRLDLGEGDDDVLNEVCMVFPSLTRDLTIAMQLALSPNERFLAFTSDSGSVGTVELGDMKVHRMKTRHQNVRINYRIHSSDPSRHGLVVDLRHCQVYL
jgi:hypothetical protein